MPISTRRLAVGIFSLVAMPIMAADAVPRIPVEDFFRHPEFSEVKLSPDGTRLAARHIDEESSSNLLLMDLDTLKPRLVTSFETGGVGPYLWKDDETLIFWGIPDLYAGGPRAGSFVGVYSLDVSGAEVQGRKFLDRYCHSQADTRGSAGQVCYPVPATVSARSTDIVGFVSPDQVMDPLPEDSDKIKVKLPDALRLYRDVVKLDTGSGRTLVVEGNPHSIMDWWQDSEGRLRLALKHVRSTASFELLYRETEDTEWRSVLDWEGFDMIDVQGFDGDDRHVIILSSKDRDRMAAFRFDPVTGEMGEPIAEDPVYDISNVRFSAEPGEPRRPIYASTPADIPKRYMLDEEFAQIQATVDNAFPDTVNTLESWDDDWNRFVVRAWSDTTPGRYYLLDLEAGKLQFLFAQRSWIDPNTQGEIRLVEYEARDGTTIRGYVSLPPGYDGEPVPMVVNPHGGPHGPRDNWGWNPEMQFFANRGWATLRVNFRGSGGYGHGFQTAGYRKWGLEMQDDITDGVKWAIEQGYADPDRICIYGASYGGYATLMGLIKTPELYQCGVNYVGVSALDKLLEGDSRVTHNAPRDVLMGTVMGWYLGDLSNAEDRDRLRQTSPLYRVEEIEDPLLMVHGRADPRVDYDSQFLSLISELKKHDKEYEEIVGRFEGHGFFSRENAIKLYGQMEEFLSEHLD